MTNKKAELVEEDGNYYVITVDGEKVPMPKEAYDAWKSYMPEG